MVDTALGHPGLTVISHAEAVKYPGFANATRRVLIMVGVAAMELRMKSEAVAIIHASVSLLLTKFLFLSSFCN